MDTSDQDDFGDYPPIEEVKIEPPNIFYYNDEGVCPSEIKVDINNEFEHISSAPEANGVDEKNTNHSHDTGVHTQQTTDDSNITLVYDEIGFCYIKDKVEGEEQLLRCVKYNCPAVYAGLIPLVGHRQLSQRTSHSHPPEPNTMKVLLIRSVPQNVKRSHDSLSVSISSDFPPHKRQITDPVSRPQKVSHSLLIEKPASQPAGGFEKVEMPERIDDKTSSKTPSGTYICLGAKLLLSVNTEKEKCDACHESSRTSAVNVESVNKVEKQSGVKNKLKSLLKVDKTNCLYCKHPLVGIDAFLYHVNTYHKDEEEICKLHSLTSSSKIQKALIGHLMWKGNKQCDEEKAKGSNIKKPIAGCLPDEYLHCNTCLGFFKKSFISTHLKCCKGIVNSKQIDSLRWLSDQEKGYKLLEKHVFPSMIDDEISSIIRSDYLISHCGAKFYNDTENDEIVTLMRWLGKLLFDLRKKFGNGRSLASFINPNDCSLIKGVIQEMCGSNTIPFRLHHYLFQCADILERKGSALSDNQLVQTAKNFKNTFSASTLNVQPETNVPTVVLSDDSSDSEHS